jgi:hypothetical protein
MSHQKFSSARRSQRIELSEPLRGTFGATPVTVIELSDDGAGIEHTAPLLVTSVDRLRIEAATPFTVDAVVRHSVITVTGGNGTSFRSGLAFRRVPEATTALIESILMDQAASLVRLWEANAAGLTSSPAIAAMQRRSAQRAPSAYIWMRLVNGNWERTTTLDPNQPLDGFSVPAYEDPQQIAILCRTYEAASIPERRLLRALAQRAIAESIAELRRERAGKV